MNIKEIRTKIISVPFLDPPKTSFLPLQTIDLLIVEIETTEGFIGTGHLHPIAGGLLTIEMCINEMLKPLLIGETIKNIEYASAACFNFKDIKSQIDNRINEFQPYRKKYKKLDNFFNNDFIPLLDKMIKETEKKQKLDHM